MNINKQNVTITRKLLLLLAIILCWCGNDAFGQTREKKVEKDGYEWYKVSSGSYRGAQSIEGRTIIPTQYSFICYHGGADGWFTVENNEEHEGAYEKNGKCTISPSRGYSSVCKHKEGDGYWYSVKKGGMEGACDANGNEIIAPKYKLLFYSSVDNIFKYEDSNGKNVSTGISLKGSSYASSSSSSGVVQSDRSNDGLRQTKKTESDGFIWYEIYKDGKYGVQKSDGTTLIPSEFGLISYWKPSNSVEGRFIVYDSGLKHKGLYEKDGECIIPLSRGYTSIGLYSGTDHDLYYRVDKGELKGACDLNGREIITPQYKTIFLTYGYFKYEDANGRTVNTGIKYIGTPPKGKSLYTSSNSSSSSSSISSNTLDFIFDLYVKKSANEELNPIPKMPKNGSNTFYEYVVRIELNASTIIYKIMTIDRKNNDRTEILESHSIVPSSSVLALTADGKIQFCEYENGKPKGILIDNNGLVAIGRWDRSVFVEGWNFLPFSLYDGIGGMLGSTVAAYKGLIEGFNRNTNFEHSQAGESNFNEKYLKLKSALQKYNWKQLKK